MNLRKLIFTNCDAYKSGKKLTPKGVMVHSTGAKNPNLKRYVGPDDGQLGENKNGNHWNRPKVGKSVHAFIGKLKDGSIATYQVLPFNYRAGHCASGKKGSGNNTHLAFEICEDGLTDPVYFGKVYQEAVEFTAYLCKMHNWNPMADGVIIDHSEGYKMGIASNHGDVKHWFSKHGKSMDTFRAEVKALLDGEKKPESTYTMKQFVKDVQKAIGAKVDGIPGPETLSKTITVSAKKNRTHAVVKPLQKQLSQIGYPEVGKADGIAGEKFTAAVKAFQKDNGCVADGEITARNKTWKKLLGVI